MRKMISALLCLLLLMTLASPAAFASQVQPDANLIFGDSEDLSNSNCNIISMAVANDTVYTLVYYYYDAIITFEYWTPGMETSLPLEGEALTWYEYNDKGEPKNESNVNRLFSDGKCLYGFDELSKSVRMLVDENGNRTAIDALYIMGAPAEENTEDVALESDADENIDRIFAQNGVLYVQKYIYSPNNYGRALFMYDLETGKLIERLEVKDMQEIFPYKDSKLLYFSYDEENSYDEVTGEMYPKDLAIYDTETKTTEIIGKSNTYGDTNVVYNEENNSVYFMSSTTVYSFQNMQAPFQVSAYFPVQTWSDSNAAILPGGLFVTNSQNMLLVRNLDQPGLEDGALTIVGDGYSTEHLSFVQDHPDQAIAISANYYSDFTQIANAMISGDDAFDIISLSSSYNPIERIIDKGYAADLSGYPELMELVSQMDPNVVGYLMRDGKLYGVPTRVDGSGIGFLTATMKEMGITQDDLPTTYLEFLDFIANYQADYGEDHEEFNLFDSLNARSHLLESLLANYVAQQQLEGDVISFDTPLFRKLIAAFEKIDFLEIDPYEQYGDDFWSDDELMNEFYEKKSLITTYASFSYPSEFSDDSYAFPLILPLDEGMEPLAQLETTALIINPRTTRMDQAIFYLTEYVKNYDYNPSILLFPDHNEPVENPNFEKQLESEQRDLEKLKASLETADPENKANIQESIKYTEEYLATFDKHRMLVSAETIKRFRETASPYFTTKLQTPLSDWGGGAASDLNTFISQYREKAIDAEGFIREMDKRLKMMMLEDQ